MKSRTIAIIASVATSLAATHPLQAAVSLTVHATANGDNLGYVKGQSYSFTWTLNDTASAANIPAASFSGTSSGWYAELTTEDSPFSNLSGTGFTGSYVRPALNSSDPWEMLTVQGTNQLSLFVSADFSDGLGVTTPDATQIKSIACSLSSPEFAFIHSGTWSNPSDYFEAFIGTYSINSIQSNFVSGGQLFTPTSLEIGEVSAVPETATTLPTMALVAGGLLIRRRSFGRRMKSPSVRTQSRNPNDLSGLEPARSFCSVPPATLAAILQ